MGKTQIVECDLLVVGGGINGCGIARDAAGRGLSVILVEQDDLAAHTSSASTKLIHGGLRYLEYYQLRLVRKALMERELLMRAARHIISPLRFVMPHDPSMRPAWMIRAGLFLYDHLAARQLLPASRSVRLTQHPAGAPLKTSFLRGYVYSDGWVDDARLVVLNAIGARERGARVLTRTRCAAAHADSGGWRVTLQVHDGAPAEVRARALVNATGPWASIFLQGTLKQAAKPLRLIKGSHIVVRKLFVHGYAYIFQNPDKRIIFAIPYERDYTLIGTTDVEYDADPGRVGIDADEIRYLCEMASRYFTHAVTPADVVWSYSGVRSLIEGEQASASAASRDYLLELETQPAPLLNVWGGKITTFRKLAEEAVEKLQQALGHSAPAWTARAPLPGGECGDFDRFLACVRADRPWLPEPLAGRLARAYGARIDAVLGEAKTLDDLGREIAPGLHEAELRYLIEHEWAMTADDILWRRSKLGLHYSAEQRQAFADWMTEHAGRLRKAA